MNKQHIVQLIQTKMMYRLLLCIVLLSQAIQLCAQVKVSGCVLDADTKEVLIGAHVLGQQTGVATDTKGYFSLHCPSGSTLKTSYIGYASDTTTVHGDAFIYIYLEHDAELDEVVVTAKPKLRGFNVASLSSMEMNSIPSVSGKPDVMKAVQTLPGIETQDEAMGTLVVRGGDPGQNLYLLDNVPLLYVNHLGGFMSVFNSDIINDISVYKGGFPAKYGGKLSSIVDITQRDGNMDRRRGSFSIGLTDASFHVEGPVKQMKNTSYILTGRKTLIDPYYWLVTTIGMQGNWFAYGFHDINGKIKYQHNANNVFRLNLYQGDDYMNSISQENINNRYANRWGNILGAMIWDHSSNRGLFSSTALSYNYYRLKKRYSIQTGNEKIKTYDKSSVSRFRVTSDWKYRITDFWDVNFGAHFNAYNHMPSVRHHSKYPSDEKVYAERSIEHALYAENRFTLAPSVEVDLGGRMLYFVNGSYNDWFYEPRVAVNVHPNESFALGANYTKVHQFSQMLFTPGEIKQDEVWLPSNEDIPVASSTQYGLGAKLYLKENRYSIELDVYRKQMKNLARYRYGYPFVPGDETWKNKVITGGNADVYGGEFLLRKNEGPVTGFVSYTYQNGERQFDGFNDSKPYNYEYERPHALSLSMSYRFNKRISMNVLWTYKSGVPYTPVLGKRTIVTTDPYNPHHWGVPAEGYNIGDTYYFEELIYGPYNSARMEAYHRLDVGLQYKKTSKRGYRAEWNFGIYNVYAHQNANMYYYNIDGSSNIDGREFQSGFRPLKKYKVSYFPIVPSFSYKIYFDGTNPWERKRKQRERKNFGQWLRYE